LAALSDVQRQDLLGQIDGMLRLQAAQYGLELFELSLLAVMGYHGKVC
jgi:hypothetical protein